MKGFIKVFIFVISSSSVFAQINLDEVLRHSMIVSAYNPNGSNHETLVKYNEEATTFDVSQFIENHFGKRNIHIIGQKTTYRKKIKLNFDSKDFDQDLNCNRFCKKITSIEKIPFFGVLASQMDDLQGMLVETVVEGSSADLAGITQGDIITYIGDSIIQSGCDLQTVTADLEIDQVVDVQILEEDGNSILPVLVGYKILEQTTYEPCCVEAEENHTIENNHLKVFPNPTDGIFQIKFDGTPSERVGIRILNIAGQIIFEDKISNFEGHLNESYDISNKPSGVYFLQLIKEEKTWTEKIVLQHL